MPNQPARIHQADIARALRAASKMDQPWAVEIKTDGTIRLVPHDSDAAVTLDEKRPIKL